MSLSETLEKIFKFRPEIYGTVYKQIFNIYQTNPSAFADVFFDIISDIDPKVVRIICAQLWLNGINLNEVYAARTRNASEKPLFLSFLDKFPLETITILLKYGFPSIINGDLFFLSSLDRNSGDWLNYLLDVCIFERIDLNHINQSTGETCLHQAIRQGSLSLVQNLLRHRVDPNRKSDSGESPLLVAVRSFQFVDTFYTYPINLNIIRWLRRYGASIDEQVQNEVQSSNYNSKINQELVNASRINPEYDVQNKYYFSLDRIEDFILLAEIDPYVEQQISNPILREAIQMQKDRTISSNLGLISWPYFINDAAIGQKQQCYLSLDLRATVAPLPDSELLYDLVLRDIPDISDTPIEIPLTTNTPADQVSPTDFLPSPRVVMLNSGPLLPTDNPALP